MYLQSRIKKLENQVRPETKQIAWDFSKMSNDQLLKLRDLAETGNHENYTKELIDGGFLTNAIIEKEKKRYELKK